MVRTGTEPTAQTTVGEEASLHRATAIPQRQGHRRKRKTGKTATSSVAANAIRMPIYDNTTTDE